MGTSIETLTVFQRVQLAWRLMRDERVASWVKKVGPAAILAYVISPIDVIPDFFLGVGQVDDLGIIAVGLVILLRMLVRFTPDDIVGEHVSHITGVRWNAASTSGFDSGETIDTRGRVRQ